MCAYVWTVQCYTYDIAFDLYLALPKEMEEEEEEEEEEESVPLRGSSPPLSPVEPTRVVGALLS